MKDVDWKNVDWKGVAWKDVHERRRLRTGSDPGLRGGSTRGFEEEMKSP